MKRIHFVYCLVTIGAFTYWGCGGSSNSNTKEKTESDVIVPVEVEQVGMGDIAAFFTGTATLEAEEETGVVAKVGGVVNAILVEEGDYVQEGQILAKLDDEKLAVQVEQARASLQRLENEYRRSGELFKKDLISAEEFQSAKYEYEHQKATYDLAKLDFHYTSILAPISGVVAERLIKVGNMVLANQTTFRVTGLDPLLAVLHVPERQIGKLRVGHRAYLKVDAIEKGEFTGCIERISPVVDPSTGTVKVTLEVYDESRRLKPGMFVRINIIHDVHSNTLLVPKSSIMTEDKESSVFLIKDSTAYRQIVETGYINKTHVEVLGGLQVGDTVVTTGKGSLKDSAKVEFVSQSQ